MSIVEMQVPRDAAGYWREALRQYAEHQSDFYRLIEIGKQDVRGGFSICWYPAEGKTDCIVRQQFFMNKWEMLGFIKGYLKGMEDKD